MDTVRSECSEGSLTSSRLDDGNATGRVSLTFSVSSSHTSRLSLDGTSTRSGYVSNFERQFQERKAAKHKKSEKIKREKEKADSRELLSADLRRKAAREAEREARRLEMDTWVTNPMELRRIELRSQERSRARMRTLKEWYIPVISGASEEVHPVFVAMAQNQSNQDLLLRKKRVKPFLSKEAIALKDEEDREKLQAVLQRQLADFTTKLEYVEHFAASFATVAKMRSGRPRRRRRVPREKVLLAPLGAKRNNLHAAKSVANLPSQCKSRQDSHLKSSNSAQMFCANSHFPVYNKEAEEAEVEEFLSRHRKAAKQSYSAVKLQAKWRMFTCRRKFLRWRQRKTRHRRAIFELWVMTFRVGTRAQRSLLRKYFSAWQLNVVENLHLMEMELHLFRQAATQAELPHLVLNLVFTCDWEDDRMATKTAESAKKKEIASFAFLNTFLSSAFADVESAADNGRSRVQQLRAQHFAAREQVRKKVVQHVFRLWKRVHETRKRVALNAQLCLKRAVRMAFGTRKRWSAEILLSVFDFWARWASFNRCKRLGLPLPQFAQMNSQWEIWLHNYQERQVRCVKAAAKAPGARLRRYFLRLHAFARRVIRERFALSVAVKYHDERRQRKALIKWREEIADNAAEKKLLRWVLQRVHRYSCAKRKLRPLKQTLRKLGLEWLAKRAWKGWKQVELHACFKRELNLSRLENSQMWRLKLHRTLDIWRNERNSLLLAKSFKAWTHFNRKRKLFGTLRLLCARLQRKTLLQGIFDAWKAAKWDRVDGFLEDNLRLDAWDAYRELSVFFPMMFYGSFSDAGAIFGGLPNHFYDDCSKVAQNKDELLLSTSGDAIRHFHSILARESVAEVRNAILQTRYFVNSVDESSGNTALHVAAQIEEPERRLEIISLLLSEGAATFKRLNRHGLSPVELSPDEETTFLLEKGIFAFSSRNFKKNDQKKSNTDHRLLWCIVTLMTREWGRDLRIPADVRTGQWFSKLREELWLRQKYIRFSPDSSFAPAILRSRGFLNALKTRLCVSRYELLHFPLTLNNFKTIEDPNEARERQYLHCEERTQRRQLRASETGSYEAYARYLLASTLDTEACEEELIPSFAGLLFSLNFTVQEVQIYAQKLEKECAQAETELWTLFQRFQQAERAWSTRFGDNSADKYQVGMLRLFSDDADADLFFRREIFLLEFEEFTKYHNKKNERNIQQEVLEMEIESLLIRTKRKLRKTEKKVKKVQEEIDENEKVYRKSLFRAVRRVEKISWTRMALERSNLRMAMNLLKLSEIRAIVERLEYAKRVLQTGDELLDEHLAGNKSQCADFPQFVVTMTLEERKTFLKTEMTRYSRIFTRITQDETLLIKENVESGEIKTLPESLHPLQKEAVSKLHNLFMLDLFRSCCFWLVENMITRQKKSEESDNNSDSETEQSLIRRSSNMTVRKNVKLSTGNLLKEATAARRSSITNARRVLETYNHETSLIDDLNSDGDAMVATYAASTSLLFEEERQAVQEAEKERLKTKKVEIISTILERNPISKELEIPPDHIVNIDNISTSLSKSKLILETKEIPRNRKKEELQRMIKHRRLQNYNENYTTEYREKSTQRDLLPVIHGTELHFGNFVTVGTGSWSEEGLIHNEMLQESAPLQKETQRFHLAEAMWKRGGVRQADGSAPSIKEVLAQAHTLSISREKIRTGSRDQGLIQQGVSEVSESVEERSELLPVLPSQDKDKGKSLKLENSSFPTEQMASELENSFTGTSPSFSLFDIESIAIVPATLTEIEVDLEVYSQPFSARNECVKYSGTTGILSEDLVLPAVQISRPSAAIEGEETLPLFCKESDSVCSPSQREISIAKNEKELEIKYTSSNDSESDNDNGELKLKMKELRVDSLEPLIQSPVVKVSLSESSTQLKSSLTSESVNHSVPNNLMATSVNPLIKWEETTEFEAFPFQVIPTIQSRSVSNVGDQRYSLSRDIDRAKAETRCSDYDELLAMQIALNDDNSEQLSKTNENFTLHGKSFVLAIKQKKLLYNNEHFAEKVEKSTHFSKDEQRKIKTRAEHETSSKILDPLGQTPSITVKVITKFVDEKVEISEPPTTEIDLSVPLIDKLQLENSPPFVKFENVEIDSNVSKSLQMEGTGLRKPVTAGTMKRKLDGIKRERPHTTTNKLTLTSRQSRRRIPVNPLSLSSNDLTLQGARLAVFITSTRKSEVKTIEPSPASLDVEGMTLLSKATKEQLWRDFVSEPLSDTVHDAYTILYPQSYPLSLSKETEMFK